MLAALALRRRTRQVRPRLRRRRAAPCRTSPCKAKSTIAAPASGSGAEPATSARPSVSSTALTTAEALSKASNTAAVVVSSAYISPCNRRCELLMLAALALRRRTRQVRPRLRRRRAAPCRTSPCKAKSTIAAPASGSGAEPATSARLSVSSTALTTSVVGEPGTPIQVREERKCVSSQARASCPFSDSSSSSVDMVTGRRA